LNEEATRKCSRKTNAIGDGLMAHEDENYPQLKRHEITITTACPKRLQVFTLAVLLLSWLVSHTSTLDSSRIRPLCVCSRKDTQRRNNRGEGIRFARAIEYREPWEGIRGHIKPLGESVLAREACILLKCLSHSQTW
jgi:hypothetical protein